MEVRGVPRAPLISMPLGANQGGTEADRKKIEKDDTNDSI
jgi:hypothetical protein